MNMTARVSQLESFRRWRMNEDATFLDFLNDLKAPPSQRMDAGAAFHTALGNLVAGDTATSEVSDGFSFNFVCDAAIPPLCPVHASKQVGPLHVTARASIVSGPRVEIIKTTKRFDAENLQDG